jgi:8-oxo-dGTP diphosphatase
MLSSEKPCGKLQIGESDMQIIENWNGHTVKLTWKPHYSIKGKSVTSVHGVCFYKENVLLAYIKGRGFNFPGGHVEKGETPEEAFHRESFEEGYVKGRIQYLGAIEVSHEENPLFDPNGKYPMIGYQAFYRMNVVECLPFRRELESATRVWVEPEEIPYVIDDHALALVVLEAALKADAKGY